MMLGLSSLFPWQTNGVLIAVNKASGQTPFIRGEVTWNGGTGKLRVAVSAMVNFLIIPPQYGTTSHPSTVTIALSRRALISEICL
jgi:hypothetical protein